MPANDRGMNEIYLGYESFENEFEEYLKNDAFEWILNDIL